MYYPTFEEIKQLREAEVAGKGADGEQQPGRPLLPFYCDLLADMESPVSAYRKTAQSPYSFLLESVTGGEQVARYSFIGIDPYMVMIQRGETATLLRMDGERNEANTYAMRTEEVPCHDPLQF